MLSLSLWWGWSWVCVSPWRADVHARVWWTGQRRYKAVPGSASLCSAGVFPTSYDAGLLASACFVCPAGYLCTGNNGVCPGNQVMFSYWK